MSPAFHRRCLDHQSAKFTVTSLSTIRNLSRWLTPVTFLSTVFASAFFVADATHVRFFQTTDANTQDSAEDEISLSPQALALESLREVESKAEKVIAEVAPCIVSIGETASGVIVKPSGIVITASHVTRKAGRSVVVRMHDGQKVMGVTLGSNAANDTSAIRLLDKGPWPFLKTVSPKIAAKNGQWCIAFGYPLSWPRDEPASARLGRVTGQYRNKIVTDCPIMGGDSGGALVNLSGNLMAINSSVRLDVSQNLHVPINRYREDWTVMMAGQDVDVKTIQSQTRDKKNVASKTSKPFLGIYGENTYRGVRIRDVRRNSPALKAGLMAEDVIWQIEKTPINSFAELLNYLANRKGGDRVTVYVNRFGAQLQIGVTLEQR